MSTDENKDSYVKEHIERYVSDFPAGYIYKSSLIYGMTENADNDNIRRTTFINHILVMLLLVRIEAKKYNLQINQYNESKKFHHELINVIKDLSDTLKFASIRGPEYLSAERSFESAAKNADSLD